MEELDYKITAQVSGIIDYINIIIRTIEELKKTDYDKYIDLKESITILEQIKEKSLLINTEKSLEALKDEITNIDKRINSYLNNNERELTSREKALVEKGYDKETVLKLTSFSETEIREIANEIFEKQSKSCSKTNDPICIYLGGQPGCGKSTLSRKIKNGNIEKGIFDIGLDNYRTYHPHYIEMEEEIKKHWEKRKETENDSPGNDIADFTHNFAGRMTDILTELASEKKDGKAYNIVYEWGMREPEGPLKTMRELKEKGYKNIVNFISVDKKTSLEACKLRADVMNNQEHIIRRIPNYFHETCIEQLPRSVDEIYKRGYEEERIIDSFNLTDRLGKIIWKPGDEIKPGELYNSYLNDTSLTKTNSELLALQSYREETQGFQENTDNITKK
jgi:UDP-N-acetylglucosamine kinase